MADFKQAHEEREEWVRRIGKAREQLAADDDWQSAPGGAHSMFRPHARAAAPVLRPAHLCPAHRAPKRAGGDQAAEDGR